MQTPQDSASEPSACEVVISQYVASGGELFSAYGLEAQLDRRAAHAVAAPAARYISTLCASSDGISLMSTLSVDEDLLARMHPADDSRVSPDELKDWCLELNNQLVGRMKNKLLGLGCEVTTGLPQLVAATDIAAIAAPEADFQQFFFTAAHGCLASTLALRLKPDLKLVRTSPGADGAVKREGEFSVF